jgi:inhibitor of cysteine peptidase
MSRSTLLGIIVLVGLLVLAGAAVLLIRSEPLVITEADAGETIELNVGQEFAVTLEGNITTGYTWEMVAIDGALVEQVGEPEFESESDLVGAGGKITLNFKTISSGNQTLQLVYHRPWEVDVAPLNTFAVTLVVEE